MAPQGALFLCVAMPGALLQRFAPERIGSATPAATIRRSPSAGVN